MEIQIPAFRNGDSIPYDYAFGIPDTKEPIKLGRNLNPEVRWNDLPLNTQSLVLLMVDKDVPSVGDQVNREGVTIPSSLPRVDFYHWVLIDIPPTLQMIKIEEDSNGITPHGKPIGPTAFGVRGINDYTKWFAEDSSMSGQYGGYDGPCPPWNDERLHHYHFCLYALDIKTLGLKGDFDGRMVLEAMENHILAEAEWVGTYSLRAGR